MSKIGFYPKGIIAIVLVISVSTAAFFGWRSNSDDTVPPPKEIEEYLFWNPKYLKDFTLNAAGNEEFEIVVFEGADHDLMIPEVEDGAFRWQRRPPGYFEVLFDWVGERAFQN